MSTLEASQSSQKGKGDGYKPKQLSELREEAEYTQQQAADVIGVSLETYNNFEQNINSMPFDQYVKLVETLIETYKKNHPEEHIDDPTVSEAHVVFDDPDTMDLDSDEYSVPIPADLPEYFESSQPVTNKQILDFEFDGIEPYPGYADEYDEWYRRWEVINNLQAYVDSKRKETLIDPVSIAPDFDPQDDTPIHYNEPALLIDENTGEATVDDPDARMAHIKFEITDDDPETEE